MTQQTERRKLWFLRLSPGNWITIIVLSASIGGYGLSGYVSLAKAMDKVESNTEGIKKVKEEMTEQMKELKKDLSRKINEAELRTRSDLREIRQILLNNGNHK